MEPFEPQAVGNQIYLLSRSLQLANVGNRFSGMWQRFNGSCIYRFPNVLSTLESLGEMYAFVSCYSCS